jgi:hypothetical protein
MNQPPFQLEFSSGRGLLDARAVWASVAGPHRLALTLTHSVEMRTDRAVQIIKNLGAADAYVFAGVALPFDAPLVPLPVFFGGSEQLGKNAGSPYLLTPQMGGGGFGVSGFMQLVLPGEQLYGQLAPGGPLTQRVVVAEVVF